MRFFLFFEWNWAIRYDVCGWKTIHYSLIHSICLVRVYNEGLIIFWEIGPTTFVKKDHRQVRTKKRKKYILMDSHIEVKTMHMVIYGLE